MGGNLKVVCVDLSTLSQAVRFTASQMRVSHAAGLELKTRPTVWPSWLNLVQVLLHLCVLPSACGRTAHSRSKITNASFHECLIFGGGFIEQMLMLSSCLAHA